MHQKRDTQNPSTPYTSTSHNPFTSDTFEILGSGEYNWKRTRSIQDLRLRDLQMLLNIYSKVWLWCITWVISAFLKGCISRKHTWTGLTAGRNISFGHFSVFYKKHGCPKGPFNLLQTAQRPEKLLLIRKNHQQKKRKGTAGQEKSFALNPTWVIAQHFLISGSL